MSSSLIVHQSSNSDNHEYAISLRQCRKGSRYDDISKYVKCVKDYIKESKDVLLLDTQILNTQIKLQQHNTLCGLTKIQSVEMGVCVTNRGFKRNLTQLTSRYMIKSQYIFVCITESSKYY